MNSASRQKLLRLFSSFLTDLSAGFFLTLFIAPTIADGINSILAAAFCFLLAFVSSRE